MSHNPVSCCRGLRAASLFRGRPQCASQTFDDKEAENLRLVSDIQKRDGLVPVTDFNFAKLVLAKHRPFHTFVLFTTANLRGECSACECVP